MNCFSYRSKIVNPTTIIVGIVGLWFLLTSGFAELQAAAYRIGPKDVLTVIIEAGGERQYEGELTVSSEGNINAPFIGVYKAAGATPSELEKLLWEPLAQDYFVDPKVNISVKEYQSLYYSISGAVKKPGRYQMRSKASLLELIVKAEGVTSDRGNVAYIMRGEADSGNVGELSTEDIQSKDPITVDLIKLLDQGDMSSNPVLKSGDVVYIPLKQTLHVATQKIYVEGEVRNPGAYDFQPGMTALNACIMAGGFGEFAAPNRARIIRSVDQESEIIKINLQRVKEGRQADVELMPGDRIHVPETWL